MAFFWKLLLAHLLADYPLQPYILVRRKSDPGFFLTHILIQFLVMAALLWPLNSRVVLVLGAVTLFHGLLDRAKPRFTVWLGISNVAAYFLDQLLHVVSLALAAYILTMSTPGASDLPVQAWVVQGIALVFSSYVWTITERVLAEGNPTWLQEVRAFQGQRMLLRTVPAAVLSFGHYAGARSASLTPWFFPYASMKYWRRAAAADALVLLASCGFVLAFT